jgi:NAD(P)-dependent dehydrogenase (short-subunit alcohol dehydrogenase family)
MDLKLAGKIVLITGSSRGIGLATAKALAGEGCRIMLSARSAEPPATRKRHCVLPAPKLQLTPRVLATPRRQPG